jgi:copper transport protein
LFLANRLDNYLIHLCLGMAATFLVFLLFSFSPVHAHSSLEEVKPHKNEVLETSPTEVELWFTDPVDVHTESIQVTNGAGKRFHKGKPIIDSKNPGHITAFLEDPLPAGQYTVKVNVISIDGDVFQDSYQFVVKEPSIAHEDTHPEFNFEKSSPKDGGIVQSPLKKMDLWFTQSVELTAFGVFDNKGESVPVKETVVDPENPRHLIIEFVDNIPPGTYQVSWYASPTEKGDSQVLLEKQGVFYFAVDEVTSLRPPEGMPTNLWFSDIGVKHAAHWLAFVGLLTLFGGTWFQQVIAKERGNQQRWDRLSLGLYGLSVIGFLLLLIYRRFELPELPLREFLTLKFTWVAILQIMLLSIGFWFVRGKYRLPFFGLTMAFWPFVSGHSTYPRYGEGLLAGVDALHLLGVSVWLGGLVALIVMMPKDNPLAWLKESGLAYSKWAFWSIVLIILTGVWMSYRFLPSFTWGSLLISEWGKSLFGKVVLSIVVIVLGFSQRQSLKRIASEGILSFIKRARMEWICAALILFAAALLIESTPSAAEQGVYPSRVVKDNVELTVEISPFRVGVNDITLRFNNQSEFERVRVKFFMPPMWMVENNAFSLGNGTYRVTGGFMHAAGTMDLEVEALKTNGEIIVFPFKIVVPGEMRLGE